MNKDKNKNNACAIVEHTRVHGEYECFDIEKYIPNIIEKTINYYSNEILSLRSMLQRGSSSLPSSNITSLCTILNNDDQNLNLQHIKATIVVFESIIANLSYSLQCPYLRPSLNRSYSSVS